MGLAAFNRLRRQQAEKSRQQDQVTAEDENGSDNGALAAEYEERTGKKAGRMKAETIREKLDELNNDQE